MNGKTDYEHVVMPSGNPSVVAVRFTTPEEAQLFIASMKGEITQEVREVLEGLRGHYVLNCFCDSGEDGNDDHRESCKRAMALLTRLEDKLCILI